MKRICWTPACLLSAAVVFLWIGNAALPAQEPTVRLKVVSELANVRLKPDIGSLIIQQFPQGAILESRRKEGEWYLVEFQVEGGERLSGYVHESLVLAVSGRLVSVEPPPGEEVPLKTPPRKPPETRKTREEPVLKKPDETPTQEKPAQPVVEPSLIQLQSQVIRPPVSLFLSVGGTLIAAGDLNRGAQGLSGYYQDFLGIRGKGEVSSLKLTSGLGGELFFPLNRYVSLIVGAEYFQGSRDGLMDLSAGLTTARFQARPRVQALPFRLGLAVSPISGFYSKLGVEYTLARCGYFYRFERENFWQEWEGSGSARGLGLFGGFGLDVPLNGFLSLNLEAVGRHSRLSGFQGTNHFSDSTGASSNEKGILYYYEGRITGTKTYPLLFIRSRKPAEAGVFDPREAELDLSGISVRAGLRFRF